MEKIPEIETLVEEIAKIIWYYEYLRENSSANITWKMLPDWSKEVYYKTACLLLSQRNLYVKIKELVVGEAAIWYKNKFVNVKEYLESSNKSLIQ